MAFAFASVLVGSASVCGVRCRRVLLGLFCLFGLSGFAQFPPDLPCLPALSRQKIKIAKLPYSAASRRLRRQLRCQGYGHLPERSKSSPGCVILHSFFVVPKFDLVLVFFFPYIYTDG